MDYKTKMFTERSKEALHDSALISTAASQWEGNEFESWSPEASLGWVCIICLPPYVILNWL